MNLEVKVINDNEVVCVLDGTLDTVSSMEFDDELTELAEKYDKITYDCAELDYITSAGLRLIAKSLLLLQQRGGELIMKSVNEEIMAVFKMVAYDKLLKFE